MLLARDAYLVQQTSAPQPSSPVRSEQPPRRPWRASQQSPSAAPRVRKCLTPLLLRLTRPSMLSSPQTLPPRSSTPASPTCPAASGLTSTTRPSAAAPARPRRVSSSSCRASTRPLRRRPPTLALAGPLGSLLRALSLARRGAMQASVLVWRVTSRMQLLLHRLLCLASCSLFSPAYLKRDDMRTSLVSHDEHHLKESWFDL